jgi:hypothetical protein
MKKNKRRIAPWTYILCAVGLCIYLAVVTESIVPAIVAVVLIEGMIVLGRIEKESPHKDPPGSPGEASAGQPD